MCSENRIPPQLLRKYLINLFTGNEIVLGLYYKTFYGGNLMQGAVIYPSQTFIGIPLKWNFIKP
jgi:hypothetical protein